jgi:hypothetical protein
MTQFDEAEMDTLADERAMTNYRAAPTSQVQSIDADYFTIVDAEDWPIAGLIILLDRRRHAVRAELHLYEDGERQNEYALHQAQNILTNQYFSTEAVQLQLMQSYPWRETLEIQANAAVTPETDLMALVRQYWQYILGASALIILILFIWLIASFFRSPDEAATAPVDLPTQAQSANDAASGDASSAPAEVATTTTVLGGEQTNGLPASRNADANLAVGQRARVLPGFTVSLVSQPVPDQALVVGFLEAGQEATIFDGPVYKAGNSDTIVWWRVRLDNGLEAWAPANTSDAMLLTVAN